MWRSPHISRTSRFQSELSEGPDASTSEPEQGETEDAYFSIVGRDRVKITAQQLGARLMNCSGSQEARENEGLYRLLAGYEYDSGTDFVSGYPCHLCVLICL